jgi:hypothetical protein
MAIVSYLAIYHQVSVSTTRLHGDLVRDAERHAHELSAIHAERDRKLEQARQQRQLRRGNSQLVEA